ncbi:MAG: hypothetical protein AAF074_00025 [Pseudomonadota bacterium]
MTDREFEGDNFAYVGPWRIETGDAWRDWQISALEACMKASEHSNDEVSRRRFAREIDRLSQVPLRQTR